MEHLSNNTFAKVVAGTNNKLQNKSQKKNSNPKETLCKYYNFGNCKHGFSGTKEHDGKSACGWNHPKICSKMFKFGLDVTKGCKGKGSGCKEFHPALCSNHIKGSCDGKDCRNGFHLRSILRMHKRKNEEERKSDEQNRSATSEQNSSTTLAPRTNTVTAPTAAPITALVTAPSHTPAPPASQARDPFLESILNSIKEIQKDQKDQQAVLISLLEDQKRQKDQSPPEWLQRWRNH